MATVKTTLPADVVSANSDNAATDDPVAAIVTDIPELKAAVNTIKNHLEYLHGEDGDGEIATVLANLSVYTKAAVDAKFVAANGFDLIGSAQTLSGTTQALDGMTGAYGVYVLRVQGLLLNNAKLELRTKKDGSGSYQSGASDYDTWKEGNSSAGASSVIDLSSADNLSNSVGAQAEFWIENARSTTANCRIHGWLKRRKQAGNFGITHILGEYVGGVQAIQGLQLRANGASFSGGQAALYGVRGLAGG